MDQPKKVYRYGNCCQQLARNVKIFMESEKDQAERIGLHRPFDRTVQALGISRSTLNDLLFGAERPSPDAPYHKENEKTWELADAYYARSILKLLQTDNNRPQNPTLSMVWAATKEDSVRNPPEWNFSS